MATISVRAAAGVGATGAVQTDPSGLRGRLRILTGASGLAAGLLAVVTLDAAPFADLDAFNAAFGIGNAVFSGVEVLLTPWTLPPAGCAFQPVAQVDAQGQAGVWAVMATAPLVASTAYRFGWRVLA